MECSESWILQKIILLMKENPPHTSQKITPEKNLTNSNEENENDFKNDSLVIQAIVLLDCVDPDNFNRISDDDLNKRINTLSDRISNKQFEIAPILTRSSRMERVHEWNSEEYKDMSHDDKKNVWFDLANKKLEKSLENSETKTVFEKLDITEENPAKTFYDEYFDNVKGHNGDISYFAMRICESFTDTELHDVAVRQAINGLSQFYGEETSILINHYIDGIKNVQRNKDKFVKDVNNSRKSYIHSQDIDLIKNAITRESEWKKLTSEEEILAKDNEPIDVFDNTGGNLEKSTILISETSEKSISQKPVNDDSYFVDVENSAAGVFDGMGSYPFSCEAAVLGAQTVKDELGKSKGMGLEDTKNELITAVEKAGEALKSAYWDRYEQLEKDIVDKSNGLLSDDEFGQKWERNILEINEFLELIKNNNTKIDMNMLRQKYGRKIYELTFGATTASIVKLWEGEQNGGVSKKALIANLGDSRVYKYSNSKLECLTLDDNELHDLLGPGLAKQSQDLKSSTRIERMKPQEGTILLQMSNPVHKKYYENEGMHREYLRKNYPLKSSNDVEIPRKEIDSYTLTKGLMGTGENPNIYEVDVDTGDVLLLVSDGICDGTTSDEIEELIKATIDTNFSDVAPKLATLGMKNNGDDATAVVLRIS